MDPTACLLELLELLSDDKRKDENRDEIVEHLESLQNWIGKGGFLPGICKTDNRVFQIDG
jgi:hypothetical protein